MTDWADEWCAPHCYEERKRGECLWCLRARIDKLEAVAGAVRRFREGHPLGPLLGYALTAKLAMFDALDRLDGEPDRE